MSKPPESRGGPPTDDWPEPPPFRPDYELIIPRERARRPRKWGLRALATRLRAWRDNRNPT